MLFVIEQSFTSCIHFSCRHLQNNGQLKLDVDLAKHLPSLKNIHLQGNELRSKPSQLFNSTQVANVFNITRLNFTKETKRVDIKCNFYRKPLRDCSSSTIQDCGKAVDIEKDIAKMSPFTETSCVYAKCERNGNEHAVTCVLHGVNNRTDWSIIGNNTGVKLALWTFGLLAVTSNLLVFITLLCNNEMRKSALCIFVMNLLTANIFIGGHIVIITILDTVTYGNVDQYGGGKWEGNWCVPLFVIKHFGLTLMILSLVLLTIERALVLVFNAPNHVDLCRAVGYVIECWLFASIATVVLWSKLKDWGYMCSTFASSLPFADISKGVKGTFTGICLVLIAFYIYVFIRMTLAEVTRRRTRKENAEHVIFARESKTTTRLFLLVLTTFLSWSIPYVILIVLVPASISAVTAMRTITIALAVNACIHPFVFSYDNEHLENLYSALACRKECLLTATPWYASPEMRRKSTAVELEAGTLPKKSSLESNSVVEVKSPLGSGTVTRAIPAVDTRTERSLSGDALTVACEVFRTDGAVIITPPKSKNEEEVVVLMHSTPSSPTTSAKEMKLHDETISESGTISSDTNATWLTSDAHSIVPLAAQSSCRFIDGHSTGQSTLSSVTSTTPLFKPRRNSRRKLKRSSLRKSLSPKSDIDTDDESSCVEKAQSRTYQIPLRGAASSKSSVTNGTESERTQRPLSPVEKLARVFSPKTRRERPKTLPPQDFTKVKVRDRGKSMLEGKEARSANPRTSALEPLPPIRLRSRRKSSERSGKKRNGVLVFKAGEDGLEIQEGDRATMQSSSDPQVASLENNNQSDCKTSDSKNSPSSPVEKDWDRLATFLVIKPIASKAKMKVNTKGRKKSKSEQTDTPPNKGKVRIFENPTADMISAGTSQAVEGELNMDDAPLSPTSKRLAKLEGGDTLTALPKGIKQKYRNSTSSTTSSTCTRNSKSSLEWDPCCAGDDYDIDNDFMPPPPPPPPKSFPVFPPSPCPSSGSSAHAHAGDGDEQVECVQVKLDPNNRYSLEWDPTGVQMRLSIITQNSEAESEQSEGSRDSNDIDMAV